MDLLEKLAATNGVISAENGNLTFPDGESVQIVQPQRRALVYVNGGVADYVADPGIEIDIVDWDLHAKGESPANVVAPAFFDLANKLNIALPESSRPLLTSDVLDILTTCNSSIHAENGNLSFENGSSFSLSAARDPRVFVSVSGGVAWESADPSVHVEVFDFDNHRADPVSTDPVPYSMRDLAEAVGAPVQDTTLSNSMRAFIATALRIDHSVVLHQTADGVDFVNREGQIKSVPTVDEALVLAAEEYGVMPDWSQVATALGVHNYLQPNHQVRDGLFDQFASHRLEQVLDAGADPEFARLLSAATRVAQRGDLSAIEQEQHFDELTDYMKGAYGGVPPRASADIGSDAELSHLHKTFVQFCSASVDSPDVTDLADRPHYRELVNAVNRKLLEGALVAPVTASAQKRVSLSPKPAGVR